MAKKRIFSPFFLIETHQNIFDSGGGNKKCLGIISKHFMFSYQIFFFLKIFHDGSRGSKHGKFKSKKQNLTNFNFDWSEASVNPIKGPHKSKNQSRQK